MAGNAAPRDFQGFLASLASGVGGLPGYVTETVRCGPRFYRDIAAGLNSLPAETGAYAVIFFVVCDPEAEEVIIKGRMESAGRKTIAHMVLASKPGQTFRGYTYDDLRALGTGSHELPRRSPAPNTAPGAEVGG